MASSHRPRKKRPDHLTTTTSGTISLNPTTNLESPAFPLVAFFWPAKGSGVSQWILIPSILMLAFLFRITTALWPYSGLASPPLHGDFEAQRHWLELTLNLPVTHWYFHDLEWWGLDYPPLTAYHSWLLAQIGNVVNPDWFALYLSRGLDDPSLKIFMRATVLASEGLLYVPAALLCVRQLAKLHSLPPWDSSIALAAFLLQPATILIDHGHFQYNTVMLGFMLASIASLLAGRAGWGAVFFVGALGFKQMALFYAPCIAAYLAGICVFPRLDVARFVGIAVATVVSFALLVLPLVLGTAYDTYRNVPLPSDIELPPLMASLPSLLTNEKNWYYPYVVQLAQLVHRVFPFSRGLFEDKVANIWCAVHSSSLHKLTAYAPSTLSRAALLLTLAAIAPPCAIMFLQPRRQVLLPALATTAWGFFLCSYQVHEKNVLLPLLPMTLMLAGNGGLRGNVRTWVAYANVLGCWTMFPLLKRDGLRIPYFVLTGMWTWLMGCWKTGGVNVATNLLHLSSYAAMLGWHLVEAFMDPPENKPDLWVVANVCIGAAGFGLCYLWCLWRTLEASDLLYSLGVLKRDEGKKTR